MLYGKVVQGRLHSSCRIADKYYMKDIFIVIEISSLQQYLIVDAAAANDIIKNCERSINSTIKAGVKVYGNLIVFSVDAGNENTFAVIEAAEHLLSILNRYDEDIHEFSMMMLQRRNTDTDKLVSELRQTYFSVAVDRGLLIENSIASSAGMAVRTEGPAGYRLISLDTEQPEQTNKAELGNLIVKEQVAALVRLILPVIDDEKANRNFLLCGKSELAVRLNLDEAVNVASGKNHSRAAVYIECLEKETNIIMPFIRSIDGRLIQVVEEYLKGVELQTWLSGKKKLVNVNSDYPEEYFFSVYCLYLKGIMLFFADRMQTTVLVISGVKKNSDQFIRYIERILDYLKQDIQPSVFFLQDYDEMTSFDFQLYDYFSDIRKVDCRDLSAPTGLCSELNYQYTRLLFVLKLTEGLFAGEILESFLMRLDFDMGEISSGFSCLENNGCIVNNGFLRVYDNGELNELLDKVSDKADIACELAKFIIENITNSVFNDYGRCATALDEYALQSVVGDAIFHCLTVMLDFGQSSFVLNYLSNNDKLNSELSDALELRCLLIENQKNACLGVLKGLPDKPESPFDMKASLLMLENARYFHAMSDNQRALDYIKKVLIFLQDRDEPRFEGIAFIELGFLMLCKGKLLESSEYLGLAVERLIGTKDYFSLMKAYIYTAVQQFIWGSIDSSISSAGSALEIAEQHGYTEWQFYIEFFNCRLLFELGRYYDAEKKLSDCLLRTEIYPDQRRKKIFSAWTARACVYQGKIYRGINMLLALEEDPEVLFFLSEAYYFNGNMEKAVESIEKAGVEDVYFDLGFMPLEHINWKNGFSSIEGRALRSSKGTGVLLHNIRAMQAFLLGMTGNREYGTEILFSLTRDEKISENDPYNRLYFYLYCQLLESRKDTEMIDKLTLISKALKYLQQTASRINSPQVRRQFMEKNYWNSLLVNEARREKLI